MAILFNFIWFILVGFVSSLLLFIIGILYSITGVGGECGQAIFKIAGFITHPFRKHPETCFSKHKLANIIWLILFGWWLMALYLIAGLFLCCSIIGIPFGLQCFKNLPLLAAPFGASF